MRFGTPFRIEETSEGEGVVRLTVEGELDLATRTAFERHLHELTSRRVAVRLDLSKVEFIDASGLSVLIGAFSEARRQASRLELDPDLAPQVSRVLTFAGFECY
jgi:anti-sigma B factor antagonist